jgi:hypothetical protein
MLPEEFADLRQIPSAGKNAVVRSLRLSERSTGARNLLQISPPEEQTPGRWEFTFVAVMGSSHVWNKAVAFSLSSLNDVLSSPSRRDRRLGPNDCS